MCNLFGKPVILVKTEEAHAPSDFVRSEWIACKDGDTKRLARDFLASVSQVLALGIYYEKLGDIALEAEEGDLELAFERYKQALLISGNAPIKNKNCRNFRNAAIAGCVSQWNESNHHAPPQES